MLNHLCVNCWSYIIDYNHLLIINKVYRIPFLATHKWLLLTYGTLLLKSYLILISYLPTYYCPFARMFWFNTISNIINLLWNIFMQLLCVWNSTYYILFTFQLLNHIMLNSFLNLMKLFQILNLLMFVQFQFNHSNNSTSIVNLDNTFHNL